MKIGIIGFGKMGSAIGARLVACNHELITWSRDQRKVEASKIAAYVSAPRQVTDRSDVIISILANDEATARAYCGNGRPIRQVVRARQPARFRQWCCHGRRQVGQTYSPRHIRDWV